MTFSMYGLIIGLSFALFWWLFEAALRGGTKHKSVPSLTLALFLVAGGALAGARLYHLWTDWQLYSSSDILDLLAVWKGGLGIYGALAGGTLGILFWKRLFAPRLSWLLILDAAAFAIPFGQALGRWGNYFNKELFGLPTKAPWGIEIPFSLRPDGFQYASTFHPLFLYESVALLLVGSFFLLLRKRFAELFPYGTGWYAGCYFFAYGSIRFSLELFRIHSAPGWWGLSIAQWISLGLVALGLLLFSRAFRLQWKVDETRSSD